MSDLSVELEAALVRALKAVWRDLNDSLFKSRLRAPQLVLSDAESRLGQWQPRQRVLEIGRRFAVDSNWGVVVEVLKHEMAHQYLSEVLGEPDGGGHGPAFRDLCQRLGIDSRAAGVPAPGLAGAAGPDSDQPRILQRVAKLLALAGSANQHEAELAMAEAQRLMLAHNLEAAAAHSYQFRHLGRPTGRVSEAERTLANILSDHFFVEVIWVSVWRPREGKRGSVLEVCGSPVNLEMASYVYDFLARTADRLWSEYRRARRISNRDRRTFLAGVMIGFKDKLEAQQAHHKREGLIWVGDGDLARWFKTRHPHIRWTRYQGSSRSEAHAHGRAAGREVVLHRPVASGPSRGVKLLR
jgi:Protein of unknown function (DUF2786)/SprT-like family